MGCAGSTDAAAGEPTAPPDGAPTTLSIAPPAGTTLSIAPPAGGGLKNYAVGGGRASSACKFGCGMLVAVGDRKYDTCCRACATSGGHDQHDGMCRGPLVCPEGARCRNRSREHLAACAHPLDPDYEQCCRAVGREVEPPTLKMVFDWLDADRSGKLSREELTEGLKIVGDLRGDEAEDRVAITDKAWREADVDGNGVLNFFEFACWAGPRWDLPLGLRRSSSFTTSHSCCSVIGCPCTEFKPDKKNPNTCKSCRHKLCSHTKPVEERIGHSLDEKDFPAYWRTKSEHVNELVNLSSTHVRDFQSLFDSSYKKTWTRDRTKHNPDKPDVPKGFRVLNASRNENGSSWKNYFGRLHIMKEQVEADTGARAIEIYDKQVRTSVVSGKIAGLAHECNEWYLLHGTNPAAAKDICKTDFTIRTAGSNTGTLYGRGLYFADSITKADEYSKPNEKGVYAVLVCRVLGGRVLYTDEVTPDPEDLVEQCVRGPYDTVLGDREKARGTFKEFVLFDTEDVFPEFIVEYQRLY